MRWLIAATRLRFQAAISGLRASYELMRARKHNGSMKTLQKTALAAAFVISGAAAGRAQNPTGPLTSPPEHDVHRVTTTQPAEAPPPMPPAEIIKSFAEKEEKFLRARVQYG